MPTSHLHLQSRDQVKGKGGAASRRRFWYGKWILHTITLSRLALKVIEPWKANAVCYFLQGEKNTSLIRSLFNGVQSLPWELAVHLTSASRELSS